jgi:O-antigen/teichoic acid export membrane protein
MMTGHPKFNLVNSLALALLNVGLNVILIPKYGIVGAAIAAATSMAIINLLRLAEVHYILKVHPYQWSFLKPLLAGTLAAVCTYVLFLRSAQTPSSLMLVAGILMHFVAYTVMMVLLKLPEEEKLILRNLTARLKTRK